MKTFTKTLIFLLVACPTLSFAQVGERLNLAPINVDVGARERNSKVREGNGAGNGRSGASNKPSLNSLGQVAAPEKEEASPETKAKITTLRNEIRELTVVPAAVFRVRRDAYLNEARLERVSAETKNQRADAREWRAFEKEILEISKIVKVRELQQLGFNAELKTMARGPLAQEHTMIIIKR